jgi:hypothetical protein
MREDAQRRHQEAINVIETMSDAATSERAFMVNSSTLVGGLLSFSQISGPYTGSYNRCVVQLVVL